MAGTDTNTLVERLKNGAAELRIIGDFTSADAVDEAIAALSPVLPDEVREAVQYLRNLGLFNTDPAGHREMAADLIERQQARIEELQTALLEASQALSDAGQFLASCKAANTVHQSPLGDKP